MTAGEYFGDWMEVIDGPELRRVVTWMSKLDKSILCPSSQNVFKAFQACSLKGCKVVFLGHDPLSLDNCATASALVKNGGFYLKNKSNGERQLQSLSKWIHENKADWNEKCLLVFDEVDKGFDLRYQVGLHNMLTNLPVMHGVKILAVSHTLIPMLLEDKVYAFKYRIMLSASTYVALETGYSIKINDYNEREEV